MVVLSFDVWNTLLDIRRLFRRLVETLAEEMGSSAEELEKRVLEVYSEAKRLRREGAYTPSSAVPESRRLMARALGIDEEALYRALAKTFAGIDGRELLFEDTLPGLERARSVAEKVVIVGNTLFWPSSYTRIVLDRAGVLRFVDLCVFSDEVGYMKPDRAIFIEAARRVGAPIEELVHVGDSLAEDVGGALSAGATAILVRRGSSYRVVPELRTAIVGSLIEVERAVAELMRNLSL